MESVVSVCRESVLYTDSEGILHKGCAVQASWTRNVSILEQECSGTELDTVLSSDHDSFISASYTTTEYTCVLFIHLETNDFIH